MVDITSLKARLAKLRLGSEFEEQNPDLKDPASDSLDRKRGRKKQSDSLNKWQAAKVRKAQDPYNDYTKNTGDKRKKKNKLTRSDQKRGKKDKEKVRGSYNRTKRQEGSTQDYKKSSFGEYTKNTGDKRKKKNKLTRSDKKRP